MMSRCPEPKPVTTFAMMNYSMGTGKFVPNLFVILILLGTLSGCATQRLYHRAEKAMKLQRYDEAVEYYRKALERDPDNVKYRTMLERARIAAADYHFRRAEAILERNPDSIQALETAILEYQVAINYDPTHQYAAAKLRNALRKLQRLRARKEMEPSELERMKQKIERAQLLRKALNPRSNELIDIHWTDTSLKQILDAMGKMAGINIIYDRDFHDDTFSITLHGVTFREALEQILAANGLFFKIINENTIMIIPDTPNKRRQYEELVVKTFYLSNAELQDVINLIRNVAQIQRVVPNTQLNAVTVKDTPEKVALAEKIIKMNDKARAEVLLDIEILEVNRQTLSRYGIDITPGLEISQSLDVGEGPGVIFGNQLGAIDAAAWSFQLPSLVYRAIRQAANTRVLAKPQVRASDGQQVTIRLGNRVPIPIQTFQSVIGGQQGGLVTPITQFQLTDVGINIDITPRVHHNREVTLQLRFELSSIAAQGATPNEPPTLGNRTINTTIRLKDGETNLLAGLIRQDERRSMRGIPGIDKIPILRDLFSANERQIEQTDVIFTITPHIIRMPNITEEDLKPIWIGTEDQPQLKTPPVITPFEDTTGKLEKEKAKETEAMQPRSLENELDFVASIPEKPAQETEPEPVPLVPPSGKPKFNLSPFTLENGGETAALLGFGLKPGDLLEIDLIWEPGGPLPDRVSPGAQIDPAEWQISTLPNGFHVRLKVRETAMGGQAVLLGLYWSQLPSTGPGTLSLHGVWIRDSRSQPFDQTLKPFIPSPSKDNVRR